MGLWLWDDDPQFCMYPADRLTTLAATAIAAGLMDPPRLDVRPLPPNVVELAAYRVAKLADSGRDC
jgi:hypothetical protein